LPLGAQFGEVSKHQARFFSKVCAVNGLGKGRVVGFPHSKIPRNVVSGRAHTTLERDGNLIAKFGTGCGISLTKRRGRVPVVVVVVVVVVDTWCTLHTPPCA